MRSTMLLVGFAMAGAAGCDTTRQSTVNCVPCKTHKTSCPVTPCTSVPAAVPFVPPAAPGKPSTLPPTIKEVRGEEVDPRQFASAPTSSSFFPPQSTVPAPMPAPIATPAAAMQAPVMTPVPPVATQGDVLLIPRWVYVPYSPHTPNGPAKLPANIAGPQSAGPYMQTEDRGMTVLPPMGASPASAPAPQVNAQQAMLMEQCLQQMKMMNQRMSDLEAKSAVRPATVVTMPAAPVAHASAPMPAAPVTTFFPPAGSQPVKPLSPSVSVPMIPPAK